MTRKRRGPVLANRSSSENSITTTALDGPSLPLTAHWYPYTEDEFGDAIEPDEAALISAIRKAPHICEGCGGVSGYTRAA
jgi:hypothetical protein